MYMVTVNNFVINQATIRDLSSLRDLEEIAFPIDRWPLLELIGVLTLPNIIRLKAEADNQFVGFIAGDVRTKKKEAWITTIAVLPQFRRAGVATRLLQECEKRMDVQKILLSVRKGNLEALSLYKRNGYIQENIWRNYYLDGEDAIVLQKDVDFI
ncbi:MAG: hypothetical protein BGO78_00085 [Chloroflexi bacterium 44-23]|nr:MAG: hypothetical protein BGO78_00085 [Chloroflexi bacterium 44-23]